MHKSAMALSFLAKMDDFRLNSRVIQVDQGGVNFASHLWLL
jgi:hypothetical protein